MTVSNPTPDADDAMSEAVEVIQADRDAVQAFHRTMAAKLMADITSGKPSTFGDDAGHDGDAIHQAFARHRLAFAASERDAAREAGGAMAKLKPGYPDYIDDPEGLDRFRDQVRYGNGHDMATCNNNSLGRLIDTIERLRRERDALRRPSPEAPATKLDHSIARSRGQQGVPAGMTPWTGGDDAPADWDRGLVQYRRPDGSLHMLKITSDESESWPMVTAYTPRSMRDHIIGILRSAIHVECGDTLRGHGAGADRIIAYMTRATIPSSDASPNSGPATQPDQSAGERVERMRLARAIADGFSGGNQQYDEATREQRERYDMAADAILALTDPMGGVTETVKIPEGMVPWAGGDSAPEDYDGGSVLVYSNSGHTVIEMLESRHLFVEHWRHRPQFKPIIAYTPKPSSPVSRMEEGS